MNKRFVWSSIVIVALLFFSLACLASFSTANIPEAWLSNDEEGNNRTTAFRQEETFYAQVQVNNAPDDTRIKAVWTAVDAEDIEPNFVIQEAEYTGSDTLVYFSLYNDFLWPVGSYKVDIYLNDTLDKTLDFTVE